MSQKILELLDVLIAEQQAKLLALGRTLLPRLTVEDVLQPMDYPVLEYNVSFRHEEGILEGMQSVRAALRAEIGIGQFPDEVSDAKSPNDAS